MLTIAVLMSFDMDELYVEGHELSECGAYGVVDIIDVCCSAASCDGG